MLSLYDKVSQLCLYVCMCAYIFEKLFYLLHVIFQLKGRTGEHW